MRMTNKIMQNNSLYNINNNKILQDNLSTQMSTQKKITRPSDDPIIAIRALRLRTSVTEITQYADKNVEDAGSWLDVTGDALGTVTSVVTDQIKQATKGANKDLGSEDLAIIIKQMESLTTEFYSTGNTDYAGRYIFTGYRTESTLSFTEDSLNPVPSYSITEQTSLAAFDTVNYTNIGNLDGLNTGNYNDAARQGITEQDISNTDIHRLRLSYSGTDSAATDIPTIKAADGTNLLTGITCSVAGTDPYGDIEAANAAGTQIAIYVPESGEMLFSNKAYEKLGTVIGTNDEMQVTYNKSDWSEGDLKPEHYFACTAATTVDGVTTAIAYNQNYLTNGGNNEQNIEYDVGYNQKIGINTTADEVFSHNMTRDIDDLQNALADLVKIEASQTDLKTLLAGATEGTAQYEQIEKQLAAADKAYTYARDNIHTMFESTITKMQNVLNDTNIAVTENGTRSSRLDLIDSRLTEQKATFNTLKSDNEDVDLSEVVIQLTSTELTYQSALMATGKIMQTSLMNYI